MKNDDVGVFIRRKMKPWHIVIVIILGIVGMLVSVKTTEFRVNANAQEIKRLDNQRSIDIERFIAKDVKQDENIQKALDMMGKSYGLFEDVLMMQVELKFEVDSLRRDIYDMRINLNRHMEKDGGR